MSQTCQVQMSRLRKTFDGVPNEPFLQVVDFSFKEGVNPKFVATYAPHSQSSPLQIEPSIYLKSASDSIPEQEAETCRLYLERWMLQDDKFKATVKQLSPETLLKSLCMPSPSFVAALSQCQGGFQEMSWWAVNLTSYHEPPATSTFRFLDGIVPWRICARFLQDPDGRLICKDLCAGSPEFRS